MKHKYTKLPVLFLSATLMLAGSLMAGSEKKQPSAVGLIFHADWCGSCKVMDPKIEEAREHLGEVPVLFVVLDHTDDATKQQAALLSEQLGFGDIFRERGGKTGAMLLVNTTSGEVIEIVTRADSVEDIKTKVQSALEG